MNVEILEQIQLEYQWYLQHEKRLTNETCQLYKTITEQFIKYVTNNAEKLYLTNNWSLNDLTGRIVQIFLENYSNQRNWQDATYSSYEKSLRSFFRFLHSLNLIDKNPLQNYKFRELLNNNEFIKKNNTSPDKLNSLINSPCSEDPLELRNRILLELAYSTVWKISQLARIQEVNLNEGDLIEIKMQSEIKEVPHLGINKDRLEQYKIHLPKFDERESFWINNHNKITNLNQLRTIIRKQLKPIGLDLKKLREIATQQFQNNGADIRSVQKLRNLKKIHRFQSLIDSDYEELRRKFSEAHTRNR
ncbi:MAG: tyrosine-type recombinase/integrase [SAR324 cluster bacterium]|nr:tyrosine-type recombinase/integrase [SAR324 cluster bacterium]